MSVANLTVPKPRLTMMRRTRARALLAADIVSAKRMRKEAGMRRERGRKEAREGGREGGRERERRQRREGERDTAVVLAKNTTVQLLSLTFLSKVDRTVLRHKEYLLQESQNDDGKHPKL